MKNEEEAHSEPVVQIEEKRTKPNGEVVNRKFNRGQFLGKGGFAKCYEFVEVETRKVTAAKLITKSSLTKSRAR